MAVDAEENQPWQRGAPAAAFSPRALTALSVGELNRYIAELQAEIVRVQADIAGKERQRSSAEALFRR